MLTVPTRTGCFRPRHASYPVHLSCLHCTERALSLESQSRGMLLRGVVRFWQQRPLSRFPPTRFLYKLALSYVMGVVLPLKVHSCFFLALPPVPI